MLFRQFVDPDLGCASYLIGSEQAGEAIVVDPAYAIEPIVDDDVLRVGEVTVLVLHTPGHRPEHCALLVDERLLLTGDSLFVGDAARPDLAVRAAEGAEGLFHSLRRLEELPDAVDVYPGHVAGSLCGAKLSPDPSSTIGRERVSNRALAIPALDDFVADALSKSSPRPPNMDRIVALNRGPFLGAPAPMEQLESVGEATVLDVRDEEAFAAAHLPGAINVPVHGSSFATRSGFVLGDGPIVVVEGVVDVLDVRETDERDAGYIAGSRHVPYRLLPALSDGLGEKPVVTICTTGARASIAASILAARGVEARPVLGEGMPEWAS